MAVFGSKVGINVFLKGFGSLESVLLYIRNLNSVSAKKYLNSSFKYFFKGDTVTAFLNKGYTWLSQNSRFYKSFLWADEWKAFSCFSEEDKSKLLKAGVLSPLELWGDTKDLPKFKKELCQKLGCDEAFINKFLVCGFDFFNQLEIDEIEDTSVAVALSSFNADILFKNFCQDPNKFLETHPELINNSFLVGDISLESLKHRVFDKFVIEAKPLVFNPKLFCYMNNGFAINELINILIFYVTHLINPLVKDVRFHIYILFVQIFKENRKVSPIFWPSFLKNLGLNNDYKGTFTNEGFTVENFSILQEMLIKNTLPPGWIVRRTAEASNIYYKYNINELKSDLLFLFKRISTVKYQAFFAVELIKIQFQNLPKNWETIREEELCKFNFFYHSVAYFSVYNSDNSSLSNYVKKPSDIHTKYPFDSSDFSDEYIEFLKKEFSVYRPEKSP